MKYLKTIALALFFGALLSVSAFADGKPGNPGRGPGGPGGSHFGLSDSCWNVFLSQLPAADAAKLAADQQTITDNSTKIDALNKQIGDLLKSGGGRDSATRVQIKALSDQVQTLSKADQAAQMDINIILKNNNSLLESVAKDCGRHPGGGPADTSKGGPGRGPKGIDHRGHFGLSDSCWNIFLTQISAADAAQLAADQKTISDNQTQIDGLLKQIRALKGGAKDSTVRAQIKALMDQIRTLMQSSGDAQKDFASIIRKNGAILDSIRKDCGRTAHKGNPGDPTNNLTVTNIVPNPVTAGGSASITITLTSDAPVMISIGSAVAQGPPMKVIFNGVLTAGSHTESLDLSGFGPGMYLVNVQSANQVITEKLVIQ
ncbi:MAG: T9SS type A sorting domain-containing protein [Bacteroidota bacterium]|nr:T9SS type A sorting domain-containing protein [Bacteroidota bacterium]MDP4230391.1 T9SS type A sorting domain-containing protein [Bacteroidota bacterium]MDP4235825.1 T9SS type A sorting domain-containing protein [Bacteroidota bacterium]